MAEAKVEEMVEKKVEVEEEVPAAGLLKMIWDNSPLA